MAAVENFPFTDVKGNWRGGRGHGGRKRRQGHPGKRDEHDQTPDLGWERQFEDRREDCVVWLEFKVE